MSKELNDLKTKFENEIPNIIRNINKTDNEQGEKILKVEFKSFYNNSKKIGNVIDEYESETGLVVRQTGREVKDAYYTIYYQI